EVDTVADPSLYQPSPALVTTDSQPPPAVVSEQPLTEAGEGENSTVPDGPRSYCLLSTCMTLLCCCCCMLPSLVCTIPALVLSRNSKRTTDPQLSRRYGIAALVLNCLAIATWAAVIILIIVLPSTLLGGKNHFSGNGMSNSSDLHNGTESYYD
ncbi:hypothetical protein EMCRGX_G018288, partial [Ephydatia muelleri]